ncbi:MAG: hypothetical protein MN733_28905 [Nitrososphaera sp.]|nr:hypothetical protein [Nitrososphaera sp.]
MQFSTMVAAGDIAKFFNPRWFKTFFLTKTTIWLSWILTIHSSLSPGATFKKSATCEGMVVLRLVQILWLH